MTLTCCENSYHTMSYFHSVEIQSENCYHCKLLLLLKLHQTFAWIFYPLCVHFSLVETFYQSFLHCHPQYNVLLDGEEAIFLSDENDPHDHWSHKNWLIVYSVAHWWSCESGIRNIWQWYLHPDSKNKVKCWPNLQKQVQPVKIY